MDNNKIRKEACNYFNHLKSIMKWRQQMVFKFRGKQVKNDNAQWLIGDLNHIDNKLYIFPRNENPNLQPLEFFEVDPATVGQSTGLFDINGVEISTGDIVFIDGWGTGEIVFYEGRFCAKNKAETFYWLGFCKTNHDNYNAEVIGNKFDNPQILEATDE